MPARSISPTALYTGYVWCRNGLAPRGFATPLGRAMYYGLLGPSRLNARFAGRLDLERLLLQRHLLIDALLDRAIEAGAIGQVIEVAAGLSARGWRFSRKHAALGYVEADLPHMAARKRELLARVDRVGAGHVVAEIDALADGGPLSFAAVCERHLDPSLGTAVITEGLLSYFPTPVVVGLWRRFGAALARYPHGLYLTELQLDDALHRRWRVRAFRRFLAAFTSAQVSVHFASDDAVTAALGTAGFPEARLHRPSDHPEILGLPRAVGPDMTAVIEAWCGAHVRA